EFEVIERKFTTMEEMETWKHQLETLSKASFTKDSNKTTLQYYWCSRGNKSRTKEDSQLNRISKRTQSHCSAFLNVSIGEEGVTVRACLDHVHHECDPAAIPLNQQQKEYLNFILTQGFTVATAKEKLREYGEEHPFYWLSSERSLRKLISSRKEKPWERENDDHESLEKRHVTCRKNLKIVFQDEIPVQFRADDIDEEERERREREKEEEDRRKDEKMKYKSLMLKALNKVTAGVNRCMRDDDDATRLKEAYDGMLVVMEELGIDRNEGATRGERPKKR
ncbi:hypothetical protein PMAYCL1PPCAC_14326, partial [Pristionchus mayeri]